MDPCGPDAVQGARLCPPHLVLAPARPFPARICGGDGGGGGKPADARFRSVAVVEGSLRILGVVAVAVNRAVRVAAGQDRKVLLFTVHLRLERSTTAVRVL